VQLTGAVVGQARSAVDLLMQRGAFDDVEPSGRSTVATAVDRGGPPVAVTVEPGRERETAELLGAAAALAVEQGGRVVAFGPDIAAIPSLGGLGANEVVSVVGDTGGSVPEEDVAAALARWAAKAQPWAILAPSTAWGREVAARAAARLGAGLTGDAVALESREGRLVALKPAFGGELLAAISSRSSIQMVTVRAGVLPLLDSRESVAVRDTKLPWAVRGRVRALERGRDDELETLAIARIVLGVGAAVRPDEYPELRSLQTLLGAELGASRKVTDRGWLPRARQIGITGRSIAPCLYIAIGIHGKFNHMLGVRGAGTVLAVNTDPLAPVFSAADVGIVADWHEAVPLLVNELRSRGIAGLGSNADGAGGRGLRLGGDADVPAAATVR
jgi:electron transfer flavoprotein alpha subunit